MLQQIFYVTQSSLRVWSLAAVASGENKQFGNDSRGLQEFDQFLAGNPDLRRAMLVDVIEEEFALEKIPKLGARDSAELIRRRGERKFRRTPFRLSVLQRKSTGDSAERKVLHSAISNHELVEPWMQIIQNHKTPLSGIYSVPLMSPSIVKRLFTSTNSVMFVAPHQGDKIRQVFLQDGEVRSARLSRGATVADEDYAQFVITELTRGRRYLERTRLLGSMEMLDVCVIAEADTARKIQSLVDGSSQDHFQFISTSEASRLLGCAEPASIDRFEEIFLAMVARKRPAQSYAANGENRYWIMRRIRNTFINAAITAAAVSSVVAAVLFSDTWLLQRRISTIQSQVQQLSETFRRENEKFDPIKAGSHEMQLAVDTGDYLLENRVPVPWVMNQLGAVLGDYADIRVQSLRWLSEVEQTEQPAPQRRGDTPVLVTVPPTKSVVVELTADIAKFDGNMRRAFSRIDALAEDLAARTYFHTVETVSYPFDTRTSAAVSGEIATDKTGQAAEFQLRFHYELPNTENQLGQHQTGRDRESS